MQGSGTAKGYHRILRQVGAMLDTMDTSSIGHIFLDHPGNAGSCLDQVDIHGPGNILG